MAKTIRKLTLHVDANILENGEKIILFQTETDTYGRASIIF